MSAYNLANIILMAVLLSSVLFVGLTASQGEYDPWADYNGDGVIDVRDLASVAIAYGTSGSKGKNVNVTNWPDLWQANVTNFPLDEQGNLKVTHEGGDQNVTVTNLPRLPEPKTVIVVQNYTVTVAEHRRLFAVANVEGYRYVSIFVAYYMPYNNPPSIAVEPRCLNITSGFDGSQSHARYIYTTEHTANWEYRSSIGFEVGAPYLGFRIYISNDSVELTIVLYCYN